MAGGAGKEDGSGASAAGMLGLLVSLLVGEKSGFQLNDSGDLGTLKELSERMTREVIESLQQSGSATPPTAGNGAK